MSGCIAFLDEYSSVMSLIQTVMSIVSVVLAIKAIEYAVQAVKETREFATKRDCAVNAAFTINKANKVVMYCEICNTGFTAINVQSIYVKLNKDDEFSISAAFDFDDSRFISPQQVIHTNIVLDEINPYDYNVETLIVEIEDVEGRIYQKQVRIAFG